MIAIDAHEVPFWSAIMVATPVFILTAIHASSSTPAIVAASILSASVDTYGMHEYLKHIKGSRQS